MRGYSGDVRDCLGLSDAEVRSFGDGEPIVRDRMMSGPSVRACSAQMARMDQDRRLCPAAVAGASRPDPQLRGDRTAWEADGPALPGLRALFDAVRLELNEAAWLGLAGFTVQLAIFDAAGGGYVAHRDALAGDSARRATAILYLNTAWLPEHGGCLRVHAPSGCRDIEPLGGRMVVFRSDCLRHQVLPSYAPRHAATAWYRGRSSPHGG